MIGAISGYSPYSTYAAYGAALASRSAQKTQGADQAQSTQRSGLVRTAQKIHQPDAPVQPVTPARPVSGDEDPAQSGLLRFGSDPAEMAVRMRIQQPGDDAGQMGAAQAMGAEKTAQDPVLGAAQDLGAEKAAQGPVLADPKAAGGKEAQAPVLDESKSAQEVMEEGECQTCKERKYQDGSDDPGVSFKTPTNVAPEQAASAVRGHENEHVVREQAKARQEGRKVVSQSVTYHTGICPECGKAYVSGGTTRTITKAGTEQQAEPEKEQDPRTPFAGVA